MEDIMSVPASENVMSGSHEVGPAVDNDNAIPESTRTQKEPAEVEHDVAEMPVDEVVETVADPAPLVHLETEEQRDVPYVFDIGPHDSSYQQDGISSQAQMENSIISVQDADGTELHKPEVPAHELVESAAAPYHEAMEIIAQRDMPVALEIGYPNQEDRHSNVSVQASKVKVYQRQDLNLTNAEDVQQYVDNHAIPESTETQKEPVEVEHHVEMPVDEVVETVADSIPWEHPEAEEQRDMPYEYNIGIQNSPNQEAYSQSEMETSVTPFPDAKRTELQEPELPAKRLVEVAAAPFHDSMKTEEQRDMSAALDIVCPSPEDGFASQSKLKYSDVPVQVTEVKILPRQ